MRHTKFISGLSGTEIGAVEVILLCCCVLNHVRVSSGGVAVELSAIIGCKICRDIVLLLYGARSSVRKTTSKKISLWTLNQHQENSIQINLPRSGNTRH